MQDQGTWAGEKKAKQLRSPKNGKQLDPAWPTLPLVPTVGIVFSNGPRWKTLRNFALGVLRELGVGTGTIEDRILEETACVLDEFQATMGAAWQGKTKYLVAGVGVGAKGCD